MNLDPEEELERFDRDQKDQYEVDLKDLAAQPAFHRVLLAWRRSISHDEMFGPKTDFAQGRSAMLAAILDDVMNLAPLQARAIEGERIDVEVQRRRLVERVSSEPGR